MNDTFALLFGAAIVFFFSYDRFNVATYEGDGQIDRLVSLVSPDRLRARRTVLRAFTAYAGMLLIIYFFLCAYAELLPLLGGPTLASGALGASQLPDPTAGQEVATGFAPIDGGAAEAWSQPLSGVQEAGGSNGIGIHPTVSLTVALILVGLAPTFPFLKRFDEWMRAVAHQMAGIPTWVVEASRHLQGKSLGISKKDGTPVRKDKTLLIPLEDWDRLKRYRKAAKGSLIERSNDFWINLDLIVAASAWILDQKLPLSRSHLRSRFAKLENALSERKDDVLQRLDTLAASREGAATPPEPTGNGDDAAPSEGAEPLPQPITWERLDKMLEDLSEDFRILVALFVEHGIIEFRKRKPGTVKPAETDDPTKEEEPAIHRTQPELAMAKLQDYADIVRDKSESGQGASFATPAWAWTACVTVAVAVLWSIFVGGWETELQRSSSRSAYWRAVNYAFQAFNVYGLTLLIALAIRDGIRHSTLGWTALVRGSHWVRWLPQVVLVLVGSCLLATAFMVAVSIWQSALQWGWPTVKQDVVATIRESMEYNTPTVFRGAIMALIVLALLDAYRVRSEAPDGTSLPPISSLAWAGCTAAGMFIAGLATRYVTFRGGAGQVVSITETGGVVVGLMLYAGVYSALIGFAVVYCVSEMRRHISQVHGVEVADAPV